VGKVALRGLFAHKARVLLTVLAVVMGVAFITSIYILTDSTKRGFNELFTTVNAGIDLQVQAVNPLSAEGEQGAADLPPVPESVLDTARSVDGVRFAEGLVFRPGIAVVGSDGDDVQSFGPSFGVSFVDRLELTPYRIAEGRAPAAADEVLVDTTTIDKGDLRIGGPVDVILPTEAGRETFTVVGALSFGDEAGFSAQVVMFTPATAQRLFEMPGEYDFVAISADDGVSVEELRRDVQSVMPFGIEVKTGQEITDDQVSQVNGFVGVFGTILLAFGFVGVFVAAFLIVNTFSIIVSQRVRELALLRALGASERQVIGSVVLEAFVLGSVASALGVGLGYLQGRGLKWVVAKIGFDPGGVGAVLLPRTVFVGVGIGVGVTVLAAAVPAWRASRTSPLAAVRDVEAQARVLGARRTVLGVLAIVAGGVALGLGAARGTKNGFLVAGGGALFVFVGAIMLAPWLARPASRVLGAPFTWLGGITGTVAKANLGRNPRRTGITASALMIGLSLVTAILVLTASVISSIDKLIDDSIAADVSINTPFGSGFTTAIREEVASLPEVGEVSAYRQAFGNARIGDETTIVEGIEIDAVDTLLRLDVRDYDREVFADGGVLVSAERADEKDWAVGDVIPATFTKAGDRPLVIAGIFARQGFFDDYLVTIPTYEELVPDQRDSFVFVGVAEGVTLAELKAAVKAQIGEEYPNVDVQDRAELKEQSRQQAMIFLAFFVGLLLLTLVISFLGILNTLALSIIERTREIGLLRAVGSHRRQIRQMVRWEALMVSILGGLLGVIIGFVLGIALQRALVDFQITELALPYPVAALVLVVAALSGLVAALYPAWRAGRQDILESIATE
jgi:putative ABC transport system permease protein